MARNQLCLLFLWIGVIAPVVYSESSNVFGQLGKSTTITCSLENKENIEWYDWVYNLRGDQPAAIYKNGNTIDDEYHGQRFSVDTAKGQLKIANLNEDDVGVYFCNNSASDKMEFDLILTEKPQCQGQVKKLREDDETKLECQMKYSGGTAPELQWLREMEVLDQAVDNNQIGEAKREVTIMVTADMDQDEFTCRAEIGDMVEDCVLQFEVKYKVREPLFEPKMTSYKPGSTVECIIKGNPVAMVKVTLPDGEIKQGNGAVKVVIPDEWENTDKFIHCEGDNEVDGVPFSVAHNYTFAVIGEKEATQGGSSGGDGDDGAENNQLAGIVAGIVIAAVVLIIIIVAVVCIKKRKSKPPKGSKPVPTKEEGVKDDQKV